MVEENWTLQSTGFSVVSRVGEKHKRYTFPHTHHTHTHTHLKMRARDTSCNLPEQCMLHFDKLYRFHHIQYLLQLIEKHNFLGAVYLWPILQKTHHHLTWGYEGTEYECTGIRLIST